MERTIRTIKSLTRAKLQDGLNFEESVQLAIKTIRQTPNNTLKMIISIALRTQTSHFYHQYNWSTKMPIVELEENYNQLRFSSACRITSFYYPRLRWRTRRLSGCQ